MTANSQDPEFPAKPNGSAGNSCASCGLTLPPHTPPELCPRCLLGAGLIGENAHRVSSPAFAASIRFGPYQLGRLLGKGGMGEVHEADDLETGRRVALKILSQRLDSPDARRRFLNEGRLAATINHPNSVYVFCAEEIAGVPVIAMELMPGGTLLDKISAQGPLPPAEVADIALQILDGLDAAHAVGILHRDIKPSNCFVDDDGSVKLGDYGLSISIHGHERPATGEENFMGTPIFASPEQLRGDQLTVRSDLYSLGATLYVLLAGKPPFLINDTIRLLVKVLESPAPDLRLLRPDIPKGLAEAVHRCLEKRPEDRFAACKELRAAIAPFSSRGKTAAQPWQRLLAGTVDMAIPGIPFLVASHLVATTCEGLTALILHFLLLACTILGWLLWFSLFEWKRGRTPGKAWLGLDVRPLKPDPNPRIAALRFLGRSALFSLLPIATAIHLFGLPIRVAHVESKPVSLTLFDRTFKGTQTRSEYAWDLGLPTLATWAGATFLLFAGARRNNGWLALHDWLTDTRVTALAELESTRRKLPDTNRPPVDGCPMLGPFHILESMPGCDDWHMGYDPKLLRKVWLHTAPPGTAPVPSTLRILRRPGRLRWLAGIRSPDENWDAYEFPGGRPLTSFQQERAPWPQLRLWMTDIADELAAGFADQSLPSALSPSHIWITAEDRAKLLDFPAPGAQQELPLSPHSLWPDLATYLQDLQPLPPPVSNFLRKLSNPQDPITIRNELERLATVPHEVSLNKRLGILAASAAGPLVLGLAVLVPGNSTPTTALFCALAALITFVTLPAIVAAALAGEGLILRTMGICVVDRHGHPATGSLASRRSLLAWLPTLTSPVLLVVLLLFMSPAYAAFTTLGALGLLAICTAALPKRSLPDRLANTFLVPR